MNTDGDLCGAAAHGGTGRPSVVGQSPTTVVQPPTVVAQQATTVTETVTVAQQATVAAHLCLLCDKPEPTGSYLCIGCTKATEVRVQSLPALNRGLAPFLRPAGGVGTGRSGKGGPAPLPVNEDILDLRGPGGIVGAAERWLADVRRDRGHTVATPSGGVDARLQAAVDGLLANMPWIAVSWPNAGYFAKDIRDLTKSLTSIIAPTPAASRGERLGHCPATDPSGVLCGSVLYLKPGEKAVRCEWCGTTYPPYVWAQLKTWIDEDVRARDAA